MNLKIKVLVNRVKTDHKQDFLGAFGYFNKHNVNITFDFQEVDVKGYKSTLFHTQVGDRLLVTGSEKLFPADLYYDALIFAFNGAEFTPPLIPTSNCSTNGKQPFINLQTHPNDPIGLDQITIQHEIMHALVRLAWQRGFPTIQDVMDTYYLNATPDHPLSNFSQQWNLLKPFIGNTVVMINRRVDDGKQTQGVLTMGEFRCYTLELPWHGNKINISCIPVGTYQVKQTYSLRFMKNIYELQHVPGRTGIRFHSGNYWFDVEGCILLGDGLKDINSDGEVDVTNSKATIQKFETLLSKQPFTLIIK